MRCSIILLIIAYVFSIYGVYAEELVLISSPLTGGIPRERINIIYVTQEKDDSSITTAECNNPAGTLVQVEIDEKTRKCYAWGLKDMVVTDLDLPENAAQFEQPKGSFGSSLLLVNNTHRLTIMGKQGLDSKQAITFHTPFSSKDLEKNPSEIDLTQFQKGGRNIFFEGNKVSVLFAIDRESGEIGYSAGGQTILINKSLDGNVLEKCRLSEYPDNTSLYLSSANCNWVVFSYPYTRESNLEIIYNKVRNEWVCWENKPYTSASRLFGEWLVSEYRIFHPDEDASKMFEFNGLYWFHNLDSGEEISWQTTPDTEILLVHENRVFFIRGNGKGRILFQAQIKDGIIQNETEIVQSELLENVHWALPRL